MAFRLLHDAYGDSFAPTKLLPGEKKKDEGYRKRVKRVLTTWAAALGHLNEDQIRIGVTRCIREMPWGSRITPSDIVQRAQVVPEDIGLPEVNEAYDECLSNRRLAEERRRWSHGVVYAAFRSIDGWSWRTKPDAVLRKIFDHNYSARVRLAVQGKDFDVPIPVGIEDQRSEKRGPARFPANALFEEYHARRMAEKKEKEDAQ